MNDFYRTAYEHYFAESCRFHRLIGGIGAYIDAVRNTDAPFPLTSEQAIDHIAELLAEFNATTQRPGAKR